MSDSDSKVKVTDKRMFTPDGELREDFRHLESAGGGEAAAAEPQLEEAERAPDFRPAAEPPPRTTLDPRPGAAADAAPPPGAGERLPDAPGFLDLLGILAEPIALFLGDAKLPDGRSAEDLEMARFHIDLLEVIRQKTAGNLSAEESSLLEDLLYRLRLRYVQKTA